MWKSYIEPEKYWVNKSGYFILATTVPLGMGITYAKLLLCSGLSEQSKYNTISIIEYNDRTVYEFFYNPFSVYSGTPDFNRPPVPINDSPHRKKRSRCTSDPLPDYISVTSANSVSEFSSPSYSTHLFEPNYDGHYAHHTIMSDNPFHGRIKIGYRSRFHGGKRCYKKLRFYCYTCSINSRAYYYHRPFIIGSQLSI